MMKERYKQQTKYTLMTPNTSHGTQGRVFCKNKELDSRSQSVKFYLSGKSKVETFSCKLDSQGVIKAPTKQSLKWQKKYIDLLKPYF